MRHIALISILSLLASLLVSGCSWLGGDDDEGPETKGYTEKEFYEVIQRNLNGRNWSNAIENLEALEAQFPFGDYAEQAQLELIYAHYKTADHEAAIAAADRFIRLHPQHPNVDYAYYMKGLASYSQSKDFFSSFLPVDQTRRDPGLARNSFASFNELLTRYPDSPYSPDARKRLIHLRNVLARQEIHIANYYFKRGAFLAAANRGRYVVENYQLTPAVPDGLAVMAEAYYLLGMHDLANDAATTLAANYPDHPALDENGEFNFQEDLSGENRSFLNKMTFGLADNSEPPGYDSRSTYNPLYQGSDALESEEGRPWYHWITFGLFE